MNSCLCFEIVFWYSQTPIQIVSMFDNWFFWDLVSRNFISLTLFSSLDSNFWYGFPYLRDRACQASWFSLQPIQCHFHFFVLNNVRASHHLSPMSNDALLSSVLSVLFSVRFYIKLLGWHFLRVPLTYYAVECYIL